MNTDTRFLLLSVTTILTWGLWGFFGKLALERRMAPTAIFLTEVLVSAVLAAPVGVMLARGAGGSVPPGASWNVFGVLSGACLAAGLLCYYWALERGPASVVVPLTSTYPVVAVLLSYAALGERPSPAQWVGGVLVVLGAMLLLSGPGAGAPPRR